MRVFLLWFLRAWQILLDVVLWIVLLALMMRLALLLYPRYRLDRFALVVEVREAVDGVLRQIGSWVGIPWPSTALLSLALPVGIAILSWGVLSYLHMEINRARVALAEPKIVIETRRRRTRSRRSDDDSEEDPDPGRVPSGSWKGF